MLGTAEKLTVLVDAETKRRLQTEARAKNTSVGDLVRRRLAGEPDSEEQQFLAVLAELGQRAKTVMDRVDTTQAELTADRANATKRAAAIRKATLARLTNDDATALAAWLRPPAPTAT